ncbi:ArsR/SmtB family transcription factor [Georgenia wangjunii]|uniref:ArsR/SmtB family transcription factor n=1 Tax=Georgenia wangjunii TaxID=3117730 RepID=UPI002F26B2F3
MTTTSAAPGGLTVDGCSCTPATGSGAAVTGAARDGTCETSLATGPLDAAESARLATVFKAVADPTRLRLLSIIAAQDEACVCDLTSPVDLSQPTVSHHLKVLVDAGLVTRDKRGKWAYYAVVPDALDALGAVLRTR